MPLLSPEEDFQTRSVERLTGCFERLRYVSNLRSELDLGYSHWGMEHTHGIAATRRALAAAHSIIWIALMRQKVRDLAQRSAECSESETLRNDPRVIPADTSGTTPLHFTYLCEVLTCLQKSKPSSSAA